MENSPSRDRNARVGRIALTIGVVFAIIVAVSAAFDLRGVMRGYLIALVWWIGLPLGAAAVLMILDLTGGRWGAPIRPALTVATRTLPLATLAAVPLLVGFKWLFPWAEHPVAAADPIWPFKRIWLSDWFFVGRSVVYLVVWAVLGWLVGGRWRDERRSTVAAAGLIAYALTVSFALYDWIATLSPHWYSSIWGGYVMIGQGVLALALAIVFTTATGALDEREPGRVQPMHDLGNLLMAGVVLWAYLAFSQFFIIWNGNLPHEIEWYLPRTRGAWGVVAVVLVAIHFALPFGALLMRTAKRRRRVLSSIALLVVAARMIDVVWMIVPSFEGHVGTTALTGACAFVACGGLWIAAYARARRRLGEPVGVADSKGATA